MDRLERACWERMKRRQEAIQDLLDLLRPRLRKPLGECDVLDLGCGLGALALPAARWTRSVTGIDVDPQHIAYCETAARREGLENARFETRSILEVGAGAYDIVLCSDVIEHVEDHRGVLAAVARSLGEDGAYYASTNNKWWPYEGHFGLPFLSYLSKPWADRYVRFMGRGGASNLYPLSLSRFTRLLEEAGLTYDLVPPRRPHTGLYRVGKRLVTAAPALWHFANAFQVVGGRAR